jgi:O-antigen ligase
LPFLLFFSVRTFIIDKERINYVILALLFGYVVPIFLSSYSIIQGQSVENVDYFNKMERFHGMFKGSHVLAYAMLFFSFLYGFIVYIMGIKESKYLFLTTALLFVSIFCLYKSYTRTALVGWAVFWFVCLWNDKKKLIFFLLLLIGIFTLIAPNALEKVFFKKKDGDIDLNIASSGRLEIWQHNLKIFLDSDLSNKLMGRGIDIMKVDMKMDTDIWDSHNDYLELLISGGVIGLLIYLLILCSLLFDIIRSSAEQRYKFYFLGIFLSVITMQFLSNAIIFRIESSQLFWLFMGLFYCISQHSDGWRCGPQKSDNGI